MTMGPRRVRSKIVSPQRQRHAARSAAAAHQLAAFDLNHRPLAIVQRLVGRYHAKAGTRQLIEGGVVAAVAQDHAGPHRERVTGRGPLLALLYRALVTAAEDRLEWLVDGLHGRKKVWHFFHALRPFATVQDGQALGADE